MTPTEQDKELRNWLVEHTALIEETGGAVWRELEVETFIYHLRELITADRKRVALEARLDERNKIALDNYRGKTVSESTNWQAKFERFMENNEKRIAWLKAQQEEV